MPFDPPGEEIHTDIDIVAALLRLQEQVGERVLRSEAPMRTLRRWLVGHCDSPDDPNIQTALLCMASDLEMFTPSPSGKTPCDRFLDARPAGTELDRQAMAALRAAQFHLVRIEERDSQDVIQVTDLATQETLMVLDARISPMAAGTPTAMRLCPLASGRFALLSVPFVIDAASLATAMGFVRPGRPLGLGHRCAASLYRDIARRGLVMVPALEIPDDDAADLDPRDPANMTEVQQLAMAWMAAADPRDEAELTARLRGAACLENLIDACGCFAALAKSNAERARDSFAHIAEVMMDTLARRERAGMAGYEGIIDRAGAAIAGHVVAGEMAAAANVLFGRLRARLAFAAPPGGPAQAAELDRVIQRILALREKTVDRGCTEAEAMAAAAKIAELLDRHELTLDEITVRQSACDGVAVQTTRRRQAPIDACVQPVARFCDCRAWSEESATGALRFVFFGLPADVAAARFLHDLIETTFETETAAFRKTTIYLEGDSGERRTALHSFQIGLATGITTKLGALKRARRAAANSKGSGFDLVAVKQCVVEEEIDKLGLNFRRTASRSRRRVDAEAFHRGKAVGARFEPERAFAR